jgi:hypothetical protein
MRLVYATAKFSVNNNKLLPVAMPKCAYENSPLCRRHHRAKQAEGWHLEQPEPGVLLWRTPAGRRYGTTPTEYTV